jgi:hypothetical protein
MPRFSADLARMEARTMGRVLSGVGCVAVVFVGGVMAAYAGAVTCHQDVRSADDAARLCATAGNSVALSVSAVAGPTVLLLLVFAAARQRAIAYVTLAFLMVEAAFCAMWSLVSHGMISY